MKIKKLNEELIIENVDPTIRLSLFLKILNAIPISHIFYNQECFFVSDSDVFNFDINTFDKSKYVFVSYSGNTLIEENFPFKSSYVKDTLKSIIEQLYSLFDNFSLFLTIDPIIVDIENQMTTTKSFLNMDQEYLKNLFNFTLLSMNFDVAEQIFHSLNNVNHNVKNIDAILNSNHNKLINTYFQDISLIYFLIDNLYLESYYFKIKNLNIFKSNQNVYFKYMLDNPHFLSNRFLEIINNDYILENF